MKPKETIDIKVRNVRYESIRAVERNAKELSAKLNRIVSREEYLRMMIEKDNSKTHYELQKQLLEKTVDRFSDLIEQQSKTINEYIDSNERLIQLLVGTT